MFDFLFVVLSIVLHQSAVDSPTEADLDWLPNSEISYRAAAAAAYHYEFCKQQRQLRLSPWLPWERWEDEAAHAAICWKMLREAHMDRGCSMWRSEVPMMLNEVRRRIGHEAYYRGQMPDPHHTYVFDVQTDMEEVP